MSNSKPFDRTAYNELLQTKYRFAEIVATGREVETSVGCFKKEIILRVYPIMPVGSIHYVAELPDDDIADLAHGSDTDVAYIEQME